MITQQELEQRPEIQAAAKWWADLLRERQTITGDTQDAWAYEVRTRRQTLTDEQIEAFKMAIVNELADEFSQERDGLEPYCCLGTELWNLVGALHRVSEKVQIKDLDRRLPYHTLMWVTRESVTVRQGLVAELKVIL